MHNNFITRQKLLVRDAPDLSIAAVKSGCGKTKGLVKSISDNQFICLSQFLSCLDTKIAREVQSWSWIEEAKTENGAGFTSPLRIRYVG